MLSTYNALALPYFPNYRLDADSTLLANEELSYGDVGLSLYPNPTTDQDVIKSAQDVSKVFILDVNGEVVLYFETFQIDVSGLNSGIIS
ncbi:MAG: hypothetical protein ACJATI_004901 [Halioglobus sp.]|jgi:hypothetical protein